MQRFKGAFHPAASGHKITRQIGRLFLLFPLDQQMILENIYHTVYNDCRRRAFINRMYFQRLAKGAHLCKGIYAGNAVVILLVILRYAVHVNLVVLQDSGHLPCPAVFCAGHGRIIR